MSPVVSAVEAAAEEETSAEEEAAAKVEAVADVGGRSGSVEIVHSLPVYLPSRTTDNLIFGSKHD